MNVVRNVALTAVIFTLCLIMTFTFGMIEHADGDIMNRLVTATVQSILITAVIVGIRFMIAMKPGDSYEEDSNC